MMNRTFRVRVPVSVFVSLVLFSVAMLVAFWYRGALASVLFALFAVICVERIVHSAYTLTADGRLVVDYGRFQRGADVPLSQIVAVDPKPMFRWQCLMHARYVRVHCADGRTLVLYPHKPEEFAHALERRCTEMKFPDD